MEDAPTKSPPCACLPDLSLDSALPDRTTIMNFRHLLEQHQLPVNCSRPSIAGWPEAGVMMTQEHFGGCHHHLRHPALAKNKEQQRDPEMHQTKKRQSVALARRPHWCRCQVKPDPQPRVTTAANEHDLNQLGNLLHGEEQFVSADAGLPRAPQRESWPGMDWLIAERPRQGKIAKQHPRKEQNSHQHRIHESQHPYPVEKPVSHHQAAVRLRESQIQGAAENDNQLAIFIQKANLFSRWTK